MTDKDSNNPDIFVANKSYPDAQGLFFDGYQSLQQIRDTCVVVVDTNALLVPYGVSKNSLSEIEVTYGNLVKSKRLVVPGQVAREFAKNRPIKIGEIFQAVSKKQSISSPDRSRYPLLEEAPEYQIIREMEEQITRLHNDYRKAIGGLLEHIRSWNWNDPVSKLYSELFKDAVYDIPLNEDFIRDRLAYLQKNKVPPGYKDAGKFDAGVGDLLVWQVVMKVAEDRKLPVVLVSSDTKADWFYRSENQELFPRFELVDEIRRISGGKSLHIVSFSAFLELFGAASEAVGEVRKEEIKVDLSKMSSYGRNSVLAHLAEQAVSEWFEDQYPQLEIQRDDRTGSYSLSERGGATYLISVKYFSGERHRAIFHHRLREALRRIDQWCSESDNEYDSALVFLVFESEIAAIEVAQKLPAILEHMGHSGASVVVAHIHDGGSLCVHDPLNVLPVFE